MRRIFREEKTTVKYNSDPIPDPPDTTFVTSVPLVNDDSIFDTIAKHKGLTDNQR